MKTIMISIKDLKRNLFVRQTLDQDHVMYLTELVANGVKLPPIKIDKNKNIIDGRHRVEVCEIKGIPEIEAEVVEIENEAELIGLAYKANIGGSLPPTQMDTEHTVALLLERGETYKRIGEMLGLPAGMARRYAKDVKAKLERVRMTRAVAAVTEGGLTATKAAEAHDVDIERLKEKLSGHRRHHKNGVTEMQRQLTFTFKSLASKNAALMRNLLEKFEDGDVNESQAKAIIAHVESLQKAGTRATTEWSRRFDGLKAKVKEQKAS